MKKANISKLETMAADVYNMEEKEQNQVYEHEIIWGNEFISIGWYDTRLDLVDSDDMQIDYILDACSFDEKEQEEIIQNVKNEFMGKNEKSTCQIIKDMFDSVLMVKPFSSNIEFNEIRAKYGFEWVNRVGNTAIIIKE